MQHGSNAKCMKVMLQARTALRNCSIRNMDAEIEFLKPLRSDPGLPNPFLKALCFGPENVSLRGALA